MDIAFHKDNLKGFIEQKDLEAVIPQVAKAHEALEKQKGGA